MNQNLKNSITEKALLLKEFQKDIRRWEKGGFKSREESEELRSKINRASWRIRNIVSEVGCLGRFYVFPPTATGGVMLKNLDPFGHLFEKYYGMSLIPKIVDMIDEAIGVLESPEYFNQVLEQSPSVLEKELRNFQTQEKKTMDSLPPQAIAELADNLSQNFISKEEIHTSLLKINVYPSYIPDSPLLHTYWENVIKYLRSRGILKSWLEALAEEKITFAKKYLEQFFSEGKTEIYRTPADFPLKEEINNTALAKRKIVRARFWNSGDYNDLPPTGSWGIEARPIGLNYKPFSPVLSTLECLKKLADSKFPDWMRRCKSESTLDNFTLVPLTSPKDFEIELTLSGRFVIWGLHDYEDLKSLGIYPGIIPLDLLFVRLAHSLELVGEFYLSQSQSMNPDLQITIWQRHPSRDDENAKILSVAAATYRQSAFWQKNYSRLIEEVNTHKKSWNGAFMNKYSVSSQNLVTDLIPSLFSIINDFYRHVGVLRSEQDVRSFAEWARAGKLTT